MKLIISNSWIVLITILLGVASSCQKDKKNLNQPNLLILHTDEHNFRTLGCYRETLTDEQAFLWGPDAIVETPHIDQLAKEGVICTSFYATTPVCSPSRSSFMTGMYPQNTPVVTNDIPLADGLETFASILGRKGWATGYIGKWHLDGLGKPQWEPERNFGFDDNRYMFNRGHWKMLEDTEEGPQVASFNAKGKPDYGLEGADETNFTTDFLTAKTIDFITDHKEEPFCLMVSFPDPHGPNTVRAPYDTMYEHLTFDKPPTNSKDGTNLPSWGKMANKTINQNSMVKYYGMVKCIDDNVGKIIDFLESENLLSNTIVVFTSDHGDLLGEHGKDNKGVPYEGSAKSAFIVRYPGLIKAGTQVDQAMSCVDFSPTVLSMMGVSKSGQEQGRDLTPLLTGNASAWNDIAFMRGTGSKTGPDEKWLSAITDRYKMVLSPIDGDEPWLFDLEINPDETINYFEDPDYQDVVRELSQELVAYGIKYNDSRIHHPKIARELGRK